MATVSQLWKTNRPLAHFIANDFYIVGSERQDVEQEALIGLWVAASEYQPELGPFKPFASLVIRRHLMSCIKQANRAKHAPLNQSLRAAIGPDGDETRIEELLPHLHQVTDVADDRAKLKLLIAAMETELTEFERICVIGIASGSSYLELGPYKKVDNTLFRARSKLKKALESKGSEID